MKTNRWPRRGRPSSRDEQTPRARANACARANERARDGELDASARSTAREDRETSMSRARALDRDVPTARSRIRRRARR